MHNSVLLAHYISLAEPTSTERELKLIVKKRRVPKQVKSTKIIRNDKQSKSTDYCDFTIPDYVNEEENNATSMRGKSCHCYVFFI